MPKISLENLVDVYHQMQDAYKDLTSQDKIDELLRLESIHQTSIQKLASIDVITASMFEIIVELNNEQDLAIKNETYTNEKNKVLKIKREHAFIILVESLNENEIKKLFDPEYDLLISSDPFRFVTDEAFNIITEYYIKHSPILKRANLKENIVKHIKFNQLSQYVKSFLKLENFPQRYADKHILKNLVSYSEFQDIEKDYYKQNKRPLKSECSQLLFLAQLETEALNYVTNIKEDGNLLDKLKYLLRYGNKDSYKAIKLYVDNYLKDKQTMDEKVAAYQYFVYQIYRADVVPSAEYFIWLVDMLQECTHGNDIANMFSEIDVQLASFFGVEGSEAHNELNNHIDLLTEKHPNEVSHNYIVNYWRKQIVSNHEVFKNHKKYHFSTLKPIDLEGRLDEILNTNEEYIDREIFEDLLIYTGEYFPLSTIGYYSKKKEHIDQWKKYLKENEEMYNSGRWFRYGKYVEDESIMEYISKN